MMRAVTGLVVLFVAAAAVPAASAQTPPPETPSIVTRGQGTVTRAPEIARLRASTTGRSDRSDDAGKKSADAMIQLRARLKAAHIADTAIKTTSFVIQPDYGYQNGEQKFRGFVATNAIEVRIEDVSLVGPVVDAIAGVNLATIDSLVFDLKDRKAAADEALRLAVADAMSKARAMAQGAGRTAGDILKLQEDGVTFPEPFNLRMNRTSMSTDVVAVSAAPPAPPMATPIAPGPIEITARVILMVAIR
jgi:uncharacterized protein YggE